MKILLTGCNGQIGREIQRNIPNNNHFAFELISLPRKEFDISNLGKVQQIINTYSPTLVINAAAYTAVDKAEEETTQAFAVNAQGPLFLAKACEQADIPLIHISTDYVFDGLNHQPYQESNITSPQSVYGLSKLQGEEAIRTHLRKHIILRTSWVFGYFGHNFIKTILRLSQEKEQLSIVADQLGCPTSASSIANAIWQIIHSLTNTTAEFYLWGTYHYTNLPAVSWYDFAKSIVQEGSKYKNISAQLIPIRTDQYPTLAKRPFYSVLNCEKIESIFNIKQISWSAELELVIQELLT